MQSTLLLILKVDLLPFDIKQAPHSNVAILSFRSQHLFGNSSVNFATSFAFLPIIYLVFTYFNNFVTYFFPLSLKEILQFQDNLHLNLSRFRTNTKNPGLFQDAWEFCQ